MEIPINRDLRKFKTRDVGRFSFKEFGWLCLGLLMGYGMYAIQKWVIGMDTDLKLIALAMSPPLAFGFLKIRGMTLKEWLSTVFTEKYLTPKNLMWEKEYIYEIDAPAETGTDVKKKKEKKK